jgi:hypothetical protein
VGWKGKAILIPGRSLSGKTTLVAELVRAGATYYSDEYAVLDANGFVHAYGKPLSIRREIGARQEKRSIEEYGGKLGIKALPVGLVVVSQFREGASWRPRRLTAGLGALSLLDNMVAIRRQPEKALPIVRRVLADAVVLKGVRVEAGDLAPKLLAALGQLKENE